MRFDPANGEKCGNSGQGNRFLRGILYVSFGAVAISFPGSVLGLRDGLDLAGGGSVYGTGICVFCGKVDQKGRFYERRKGKGCLMRLEKR